MSPPETRATSSRAAKRPGRISWRLRLKRSFPTWRAEASAIWPGNWKVEPADLAGIVNDPDFERRVREEAARLVRA